MTLSLSAQRNMQVWEGSTYSEFPTNEVDSVTFLLSPEGTPRTTVTPQFKIENDYWFVSYDEGYTWTQLGKATGEQGPQGEPGEKGERGDGIFQSVTQDDNYIYLTMFDGTLVKIAKESSGSIGQPGSDFIYEVTFDANGGYGTMPKETFYYGTVQKLYGCTFNKDNCVFVGWNTQPNGKGLTYSIGATLTINKNFTLYAQWLDTANTPVSNSFYVSETKQVRFAPGNLQYTQSTNTWSFAEHQYDIIANRNVSGSALADKIDLFGWSASNTTAPFGISISENNADYAGNFVDWGTNQIGNDAPNTWRTLTYDEWEYLFMHTRWTMAKVNNILGFMLLPDKNVAGVSVLGDGNMSSNNVHFSESDYADNQYTVEQFAQFEAMGCVFLPCAGTSYGSNVYNVGSGGFYWSATPNGSDLAGFLYFYSSGAYTSSWCGRYDGQSVRLVQDLK